MSNTQASYGSSDSTPDTVLDMDRLNETNPDYLIDQQVPEDRDDSEPGNDLTPQLDDADAIDASGTSVDQRLADSDAEQEMILPELNEQSSYTVASMESDESLGETTDISDVTAFSATSTDTGDDFSELTARELMHADVSVARVSDSLVQVAQQLRDLNVGSLPVLDEAGTLVGIITDRDIVINAVAAEMDLTQTTCGDIIMGNLITVGADDDLDTAVSAMMSAHVRRLPVMENGELVGIISQADIARRLPFERVGELVEEISLSS